MKHRRVILLGAAIISIALVAVFLFGADEENQAVLVAEQASAPVVRVWAGSAAEACHIVPHSGGQESALAGALATVAGSLADSVLRHSFAALQAGVARAADGDTSTRAAGASTSLYEAIREETGAEVQISPHLDCISVAIARFGEPVCDAESAFYRSAKDADPAGRFQASQPGCPVAKSMKITEHPHLYVEFHVEYHPTAFAFRLVPKVVYRRNSDAGPDSNLTLNVGVFTPTFSAANDVMGTRVSTAIVNLAGVTVGTDYSDIGSLTTESYWTPMPAPPEQAALKRMFPKPNTIGAVVPVNVVVSVQEKEAPSPVARFFTDVFADSEPTIRATITSLVEEGLSSQNATQRE